MGSENFMVLYLLAFFCLILSAVIGRGFTEWPEQVFHATVYFEPCSTIPFGESALLTSGELFRLSPMAVC